MNDQRIKELFERYLRNDCTPGELDELLQGLDEWGRLGEGDANTLEPLDLRTSGRPQQGHPLDSVLEPLWERNRAYGESADRVDWEWMRAEILRSRHLRKQSSLPLWRYAAAAVLVLAIGLGWGYYQGYFFDRNGQGITQMRSELAETVVPIVERDTIDLADGSRIILNAGSKLRYPETFGRDVREVHLEGEGFFDVTPDPKRPFIVHAGGLRTEVLGTSFNINAYDGQSRAEITVVTGKVRVEETRSGRRVELLPEEKVRFTPASNEFLKIDSADVAQAVLWHSGRLAFDDAPLSDIAQQYYRRYGRRLELASEGLGNCRLSMVFDKEGPDEILRIITVLTGAELAEEQGKWVLSGKGCPPSGEIKKQ